MALDAAPDDDAGCLEQLSRAAIVPADLSARLQQMARFRILPVLLNWTVDYGRVVDVIEHDLEDLRQFSRAVAALV